MKTILSVFFESEKVFVAVIKTPAKGMALSYINSTENPIDLENPDDPVSRKASDELDMLLGEIELPVDETYVTLSVENVLISQFPGKSGISREELKQMIGLEIRQTYPQLTNLDFRSSVVPIAAKNDSTQTMLAVLISNQIYQVCTELLAKRDIKINNFEISQLNAHSAFLYNYPEHSFKTVVLFGIQRQFIDVSVLQSGKPVYYNLLSFTDHNQFGRMIKLEISKLLGEHVGFIDSAYFFGFGLTKALMNNAKSSLKDMVSEIGRMNAFRMLITRLDDRTREYCNRTQHIFPPCIGACIPSYHDRIEIF